MAIAVVLSAGLEMVQLYDPLRYCNAVDVIANLIGTGIGLTAVRAFAYPFQAFLQQSRSLLDPLAIVLLVCWTAYLLFPCLPEVAGPSLADKFVAFAYGPFKLMVFLSAAVTWFVLAHVATAATITSSVKWLLAGTLVIPLQLVIATRQPALAEFAGAAAGSIVFKLLEHYRCAPIVGACAVFFVLVVRATTLPPAGTSVMDGSFGWIPFAALLDAEDWQNGFVLALDKVFYFGLAIWTIHAAGTRLRTATLTTAALLACVEAWQMRVPGSIVETSDPVLALLLGYVFTLINQEWQSSVLNTHSRTKPIFQSV
jgi:hypothetical protein